MFYTGKVKVQTEDDKGKVKNITEIYLIEAVSVTDAEVQLHKKFEGWNLDFEVTGVTKSNIIEVITPNSKK